MLISSFDAIVLVAAFAAAHFLCDSCLVWFFHARIPSQAFSLKKSSSQGRYSHSCSGAGAEGLGVLY